MNVDANSLKNELFDLVAKRALQPFADKNISMDDVQDGINESAKLVVQIMGERELAVITSGESPMRYGLDDPDGSVGEDDQLKYWGHTWDDTEGSPLRNRIFAWYVIREGAGERVREIRGKVPWSWEDVQW